jgi:hypothetical protein
MSIYNWTNYNLQIVFLPNAGAKVHQKSETAKLLGVFFTHAVEKGLKKGRGKVGERSGKGRKVQEKASRAKKMGNLFGLLAAFPYLCR